MAQANPEPDSEVDDRTRRALTEKMTVIEEGPDLYNVITESGSEYSVDAREKRCTCPDHKHRNAVCKHIRRVAYATGEREIPAGVTGVDPLLGDHV